MMGGTTKAFAAFAVIAAALCGEAAGAAGEKVIEGFEDLKKVTVSGGKIAAVTVGDGVTEGKQAAQLPPGASVMIVTTGRLLASSRWLEIDTLGAEPIPYSLRVRLSGPGVNHARIAYVRPGKDTLAMPLPPIGRPQRKNGPPSDRAVLQLENQSKSVLILDNVRLCPGAAAPEGTLLLDFGHPRQMPWPGFRAAAPDNVQIVWSGKQRASAYLLGYPDPLTGDFVGPSLSYKRVDSLEIVAPGRRPSVVWLWVTHYGPAYTQPAEYALRFEGDMVLRKRRGPREMLGTEGILEGKDAPWTPKWFDEEYAGHFVDLVKLDMPRGSGRVDIANCQIAAMAVVPARQQVEMKTYLEQLQAELSRYRRQFVVAYRLEPVCNLAPTPEEMKAKLMVFQPPGGASFEPNWAPDAAARTKKVSLKTANGLRAMTAVAVAPVNETTYLSATLGDFRTEEGQPLAADPGKTETWLLERVPRVFSGRVEFHPWIITRKLGALKAREVALVVISVEPRDNAPAGVYQATLRFNFTGGVTDVPVQLEVVDLGRVPETPAPPVCVMRGAHVTYVQRAYAVALSPSQRASATKQARQMLMDDGVDALLLPGPTWQLNAPVSVESLVKDIRYYPGREASGATLIDVRSLGLDLARTGKWPGSKGYRAGVRSAVSKAMSVAGRSLAGGLYFYLGDVRDNNTLSRQSRLAAEIRAVGGRAAASVSASGMLGIGGRRGRSPMGPFTALIIIPDSQALGEQIAAFKKLGADRRAYLRLSRPDRYLIGFYARAVGADGCYLEGAYMDRGGPYTGFHVQGKALLAAQLAGDLAPTRGTINLRQGKDDYLLLARAVHLLSKARAAKAPTEELEKALAGIGAAAGLPVHYNAYLLRTTALPPKALEELRGSLITACGNAVEAMKGKRPGAETKPAARTRPDAAAPAAAPAPPDELVISVTAEGDARAGGRAYSREQLAEMLAEFAKEHPDGRVFIQAETSAAFKHLSDVALAARKAGVRKISYRLRPDKPAPSR